MGSFAMIGLEVDGRPLLRAYSKASAITRRLEFFSIKVADGPLTSRLQKIRETTPSWSAARLPARWSPTT